MNFSMKELDFMLIIDLPAQLTKEVASQLERAMKQWLLSPKSVHVLNFAKVEKIDQSLYRPFVIYNKSLRDSQKCLYCLNLNNAVAVQLAQDGMSSALFQMDNLDAIKRKHSEKPSMDVRIINPFLVSTLKVMATQASTTLKAGKPYVKTGDDPFPIEIAGMIGLHSLSGFKGSLVICFQTRTFLRIYSNMVGEEAKEITPEIQDGAGEIINIIYGQAKTILNEQGFKLEMALPSVLVGEKLKIRHQARAQTIVVPFESDVGPLFIEVVVES
jgi:chemotaxis protein CheX